MSERYHPQQREKSIEPYLGLGPIRERREGIDFAIRVIQDKNEWSRILSEQTSVSSEDAPLVSAVFTGNRNSFRGAAREVHVYVNKQQMQELHFPDESIGCKIEREITEALRLLQSSSRERAHKEAVEVELNKAQQLGILNPYIMAEIKGCLRGRFFEDMILKTFAYLKIKIGNRNLEK